VAWHAWPAEAVDVGAPAVAPELPGDIRLTVLLILVAHGLNAIGYLAHTMFLPDYVVRELGMPLRAGGFFWSMFGLGAAIGPMLTGTLADALGLKRCLLAGFLLKSLAAILPVWSSAPFALLISAILMGVCTPGVVALVSAYTLECVGPRHHRRAWGLATSSFAIAQAGGGALMAFAAARLPSYHALFCVSAVALVGSTTCVLLIRERARAEERPANADPLPVPTTASTP